MTTEGEPFSPPYLPFSTLMSFVDRLAQKPLPPRLDRSLMAGIAGNTQTYLLAAFRTFGLVGPSPAHDVQPGLTELVKADENGRKKIIHDLLVAFYPAQMEVSANQGTEAQLLESFEGLTGETRRKSMTFFLHAARYAGVPLSANFPQLRAGKGSASASAGSATSRRRRSKPKPPAPKDETVVTKSGNTYTADLGSAGKITLAVDVDLFEISTDHRDKLLKIIDDLKALGSPRAALPVAAAATPDEAEEEDDAWQLDENDDSE
jgi:hypothetical protein